MSEPNTPAQGTPDAGQNTPDPSTAGSGAAPGSTPQGTPAAEPFLKVNDRTSYATREDAMRAYDEAGKTIAQLSAWRQFNEAGYTPEQVIQIVNAHVAAQKQQSQPSNQPNQPKAADDLSPEWRAHIEFLKSKGIFPTTDELNAIKQQIADLRGEQQSAYEARVEGARTRGEQILNSVIKDAGLTLDETGSNFIANSIEDQIVRASRNEQNQIVPGSPEDRFIHGDASECTAIIKEHFNRFLQFGDLYAKRQTSQLVDQKAAAAAANSRPLAPAGSPVPTTPKTGLGFKDPSLNARVQAAMDEAAKRHVGASL